MSGTPPDDGILFERVYDQLRAIAHAMYGGGPGASIQPTALVHEAWLRLAGIEDEHWKDAAHFKATAARAMRQILIDRARRRRTTKRGQGWEQVTLSGIASDDSGYDIVALDDVLAELERIDPRGARLVELRVFGGLTHEEAAETLGIPERTLRREWRRTRAWLVSRLVQAAPAPPG